MEILNSPYVCCREDAVSPLHPIPHVGGHARVGLEDNLYLDRGVMAKSDAEQVSKMVRIAKELGFQPATPNEARKILNLKGLGKVNF